MAQKIWAGADGNYDTGGNWNGGKPSGATDDVIVPKDHVQAIISGADNENAVDLNSIYIQRGHNQDVATSGAPWYISSDLLVHEGGGTLFFKSGDVKTDVVIINASAASAGQQSASLTGDAAAADYGDITITRGKVVIEGVTFTIDRLVCGFTGSQASDVDVTLPATNGLVAEMHVYGGVVRLSRPVTNLIIAAGTVIIDDFVPVTVHQYGGTVEYRTPTSVGDITEYNLGGGFLDLTKAFLPHGITTLNLFGSPELARYLEGRYTTITTINQYRIAG